MKNLVAVFDTLEREKGNNTIIQVYNSFFPQIGSSIVFNGTLSNDMKIGNSNHDFIKSKSGIYQTSSFAYTS